MSDTSEREQFGLIVSRALAALNSAAGDEALEGAAIAEAAESLRAIYSGDTPAELLRDGGYGLAGIGDSADDAQHERWSDMIADAFGY